MSVTCYPVAGKRKSYDICEAFAAGCGGKIANGARELHDGPAMFYGIDESNAHLWRRVREECRAFWYVDNAYFDSARETYFRVTRDSKQHCGVGESDGSRFRALGIEIQPWSDGGKHVLLVPQSDFFMREVVGYRGDWTEKTMALLHRETTREIRVRAWSRDKGRAAATLHEDLAGAHVVVTWSSAAAITAILSGVPAIVGPESAAVTVAPYVHIERPQRSNRRAEWAGVLADNQFTLDEIRGGEAWRALN